ncbi:MULTISPECIES: carbohydrate ABC transporter permease [Paenibacillus]|uniref:carbohydrate ABC transporter permease n=1 Tax=Paenibacillus TaxID=44249 RepID=UPI0003E1E03B|nr:MULTISPECIES: carbohydrate ABC transporter permease [Paenibacillus]AIQ75801.1 sugar ABC transporter permease [Paenibacillus odorifer]ETT57659.1 binding-protein-dependent transport systems inner membrane component [Paenibacillus sp. FSL H8-237]MEC0131340.1 carbohydrate ABC transporter permease [Paenibacillus odorifer]MEC0222021.1 carbohydrate ABC transporter permease [Paenibacillus odorifer]OMD01151.1 sugar ABC transporter permease [Paenibacillus odorifer]
MRSPRLSWFNVVSTFILLVVVVVTLYPFLHMLAVSLSSDVHVMKNTVSFWPKGFNLNMYKLVLGDSQIWVAYKNTLIYTVLGTFISLVVTSTGAYALSRSDMALRKSFTLLIVVTMFFSGGMIPTFLVVRSLDLVDTVWGMVLPGAVSTWNLILMRTFFSGIPKELEESGRIDGLNDIGIFIRIIVPLSKASFATIALFYAVGMWNNFIYPLLYLRSPDLFPLQVLLRNLVLAGSASSGDVTSIGGDNMVIEESLKYATIMVSTLPILIVYPFVQKYFVKGAMIGAVKG